MNLTCRCLIVAGLVALSWPAHATFHLTQIEQIIGGVDGDTSAQAIQTRMRSPGENLVSQARLIAYDATGANPILLLDLTSNVSHANTGDRVLIVSPNFVSHTSPATVPDFVLTNLIPTNYLAAGKLAWQDDLGAIVWSVSWGGTNYTGSNAGSVLNDDNGDFGPAFDGPLPSADTNALVFTGSATAQSHANATDYALTSGGAVFVNNAGASFTLGPAAPPPPVGHDFAVLRIKAPKTVTLTAKKPAVTKRLTVQIQNRSANAETITNLTDLLALQLQPLAGACTNLDLTPVLLPPLTLKPNGKLNVLFFATFHCAGDPAKGPGHEDYRWEAMVDDGDDENPGDNVCPRGQAGPSDKGCGTKTRYGTLGADVLTDVVEKD